MPGRIGRSRPRRDTLRRSVVWLQIALAAIAQWLAVLSLSACWLAYFPAWQVKLHWVLSLFVLLAVFLFFAADIAAPHVEPMAEWIMLAIPTGWPAGALHGLIAESAIPTWVFIVGSVALVLPLPIAYCKFEADLSHP